MYSQRPNYNSLKSLLSSFSNKIGLELPEPDEKGRYWFIFDDDLALSLQIGGVTASITLAAWAGTLPDDKNRALETVKKLLHRNLAAVHLEDAPILSFEKHMNEILIYTTLSGNGLTLWKIEKCVDNFILWLNFWKNEISTLTKTASKNVLRRYDLFV